MKRIAYNLTLLILSAILMTACGEDLMSENRVLEAVSNKTRNENINVRSLDEALEYAENFFSQYEDGVQTRAARTIESIEYITSREKTRSGVLDTLFYLVNYSSNQGFALLGRHSESHDIYAISNEGRLRMSDTIENKGLAEFFCSCRRACNCVRKGSEFYI